MHPYVVTPQFLFLVSALALSVFGNQSVRAEAQIDPGSVPVRMQIADPSDSVTGNTYTSPQFGYSVIWKSPWVLGGEPISEIGQFDEIRLTAGNGHARYIGVFPLPHETASFDWHFDWYLEVLKQDHPDAKVEHEYTGRAGAMVISYTRAGVPTTETVSYIDLMQGMSTLLTIYARPTATLYQDRSDVENAISFSLPDAENVVPVENDPGRAYGEAYTEFVWCEEVKPAFAALDTVYGYCSWPFGLPDRASCIETGTGYLNGKETRGYLCEPAFGSTN